MKRPPLKRKTPLRSAMPVGTKTGMTRRSSKRKPRSAEEYARIYGSKSRVEFVKRLPCAACGYDGELCDNHHIRGDGVSRKSAYTNIIPLCTNCHHLWHDEGRGYVAVRFGLDAEAAARVTENAWQCECARRAINS